MTFLVRLCILRTLSKAESALTKKVQERRLKCNSHLEEEYVGKRVMVINESCRRGELWRR